MTLFEFVSKYFDQPNVGNTTENKGQCVGLVSVAMDELNIPHEWGNAKDLLSNANSSYFEIFLNSIKLIPSPGDILVYGSNYGGGDGHTALCVWASQMKLVRFEQNNPVGSNPILATIGYDNNVNGLLGWLHPINGFSTSSTDPIILAQSDAFIAVCTKLNIAASKDLALAEINKFIALEDQMPQKDKQLADANAQIAQLDTKLVDIQQQHDSLMAQATLQAKTIQDQDNQIKDLSTSIDSLKTQLQTPVLNGWRLFVYKLLIGAR